MATAIVLAVIAALAMLAVGFVALMRGLARKCARLHER